MQQEMEEVVTEELPDFLEPLTDTWNDLVRSIQPEQIEEEQADSVLASEPEGIDIPPEPQLSLAEQVMMLANMPSPDEPIEHYDPDGAYSTSFWSGDSTGMHYVGELWIDPATGIGYKMVTDGHEVWL